MSTNVKRATRKGLLPDYYSILAIIFNIIQVFFSKTFLLFFVFPPTWRPNTQFVMCDVTRKWSIVLYGMVWYGVAWYMVWNGNGSVTDLIYI